MTNASRLSADPSPNPTPNPSPILAPIPTPNPTPNPIANATALAREWIILNSGCEDLMSYEEWCARRAAAVAYSETWTEDDRTEFFYAVADMACTVTALLPTPGLRMTPETMAHELRRLDHIVYALDDDLEDAPSYDWLTFTDPLMSGMTVGEIWRYAHARMNLAYGKDQPCALPANADVKIADFMNADRG